MAPTHLTRRGKRAPRALGRCEGAAISPVKRHSYRSPLLSLPEPPPPHGSLHLTARTYSLPPPQGAANGGGARGAAGGFASGAAGFASAIRGQSVSALVGKAKAVLSDATVTAVAAVKAEVRLAMMDEAGAVVYCGLLTAYCRMGGERST